MDVIGGGKQTMAGLIGDLLKGTPFGTLGLQPIMKENQIIIDLTEAQLQTMLLEKADDRAKSAVTVKCTEGKISLIIKMF